MKKSKITKRNAFWRNIFWTLSFLSNIGLLLGFFIYGLIEGENKYGIALAGIVGMVLAVVSILIKKHWRTPLILLMVGLYLAIQRFEAVLVTVAIAIVLDELIFTPLYHHFREKTSINIEIDRREQ